MDSSSQLKVIHIDDAGIVLKSFILADSSIATTLVYMNDPITGLRIRQPCRSFHCNHIQCFDYESYISTNKALNCSESEFVCPLCFSSANPSKIYCDVIMLFLLHHFGTYDRLSFRNDGLIDPHFSDRSFREDSDNESPLLIHINDIVLLCSKMYFSFQEKSIASSMRVKLAEIAEFTVYDAVNYFNNFAFKPTNGIDHNIIKSVVSARPYSASSFDYLLMDIMLRANLNRIKANEFATIVASIAKTSLDNRVRHFENYREQEFPVSSGNSATVEVAGINPDFEAANSTRTKEDNPPLAIKKDFIRLKDNLALEYFEEISTAVSRGPVVDKVGSSEELSSSSAAISRSSSLHSLEEKSDQIPDSPLHVTHMPVQAAYVPSEGYFDSFSSFCAPPKRRKTSQYVAGNESGMDLHLPKLGSLKAGITHIEGDQTPAIKDIESHRSHSNAKDESTWDDGHDEISPSTDTLPQEKLAISNIPIQPSSTSLPHYNLKAEKSVVLHNDRDVFKPDDASVIPANELTTCIRSEPLEHNSRSSVSGNRSNAKVDRAYQSVHTAIFVPSYRDSSGSSWRQHEMKEKPHQGKLPQGNPAVAAAKKGNQGKVSQVNLLPSNVSYTKLLVADFLDELE